MKRLAALFVLAILTAACGGSSKPMTASSPATEPVEAEAAPGGDEDGASSDDKAEPTSAPAPDQNDPCGGDE